MTVQKLVVLHTNDLHSFFEQMPKVASALKALRQHYLDEEVLVIDCGDHMDRARVETEGTAGMANIMIMNETGYDFAVLGNNEGLTFTPEVLSQLYGEHARFKLLGSNVYDAKERYIPSWMSPYSIVRKGELRVAVIGVTINFTQFYQLLGWDIRDPLQVTEALVAKLRPQADIIIVLSHLGLGKDKEMAEQITGIDCIFGAHTHHLLAEPLRIGSTYICAAGKFGQHVGECEMVYDLKRRRMLHVTGRCIKVEDYDDDPAVQSLVEQSKTQGEERLSQVVITLDEPLTMASYDESPLGNLLAAGLRQWTDADIGIVNSGQLMHGFEAGQITAQALLTACPSPINPCRMRLKGKYIRIACEESLLSEYVQLPIRGFGFRGNVLGKLCFDGMSVIYDDTLNPYAKITQILINDQPLDPERYYTVGTIDMFTFGIGYTSFTKGRDVEFYLPEFLRDILRHQLANKDEVKRCRKLRWRDESMGIV